MSYSDFYMPLRKFSLRIVCGLSGLGISMSENRDILKKCFCLTLTLFTTKDTNVWIDCSAWRFERAG